MAEGRGVAAPERAPTVDTVGRLADVQFIDLGDGSERLRGPLMSWLSAARAGTQLPHPDLCAVGRIAGWRLM
jgi:hypothetical protein